MGIELVAFDLDGTIMDNGDTIVAECTAAIAGLHDLGIRCVIDSGRSADFQAELLARHELLAQFDALIGDERWVYLIDSAGQTPQLRSFEPWNTDVGQRWQRLEPDAARWSRRLQSEAEQRGWPCELTDAEASRDRGLWAGLFESTRHAVELMTWLEPQLAGSGLTCNSNGTIIHIYDQACDKGTTLSAVAQHLGVPNHRVLAFGDNFNDRPLLDGRHGFAAATVDNAAAAVKDWVRATGGRVADRTSGAGVAQLLAETFPALGAGATTGADRLTRPVR